ncbi:autotransporter domain-containing protein [Helicobacter winghamensis]|uniref:autotransporter family protein n=1 Tax=Helicobacter winghamensis TaxID=157268 RepID=UPI0001A29421|nr:autotransporter domain-containing protein [Helicobacter winghamensis]EEO26387.1 outer membrane autotransporter barrel domain protein [Helicobacter winghamensis ATCC BAA-430]
MSKLSLVTSRILLGVGIAGAVVANAVTISDKPSFDTNFKYSNGSITTSDKSAITTDSNSTFSYDVNTYVDKDGKPLDVKNLNINADGKELTVSAGASLGGEAQDNYAFNIKAKTINIDSANVFQNSNITGDTTFTNSLNVTDSVLNIKGNTTLGNNTSLDNGRININGDLTANGGTFNFAGNSLIHATGAGNITGSTFNLDSGNNFFLGKYTLVQADKKLNANAATNTLGKISYDRHINSLLSNPNTLGQGENGEYEITMNINQAGGNSTNTLLGQFGLDYKLELSKDGKTLYINGESTADLSKTEVKALLGGFITQEQTLVTAATQKLNTSKTGKEASKKGAETGKKDAEAQKKNLQAQLETAKDQEQKDKIQQQIDAQDKIIADTTAQINKLTNELKSIEAALKDLANKSQGLTAAAGKTEAIDIIKAITPNINANLANSALTNIKDKNNTVLAGVMLDSGNLASMTTSLSNAGNNAEAIGILNGIVTAKGIDNSKILGAITNTNFFKTTRDNAKAIANLSDSSSSATNAINVSNDMAIGSRIARFNNPYGDKFASVASDTGSYKYYDTYTASVWTNVFGGANIIDGESGGLYGISVGVDGNLTDNVLLGGYITYANATLEDNLVNQESDNFQFGAYSLIKLNPTWELNLRAYGQFGKTDQEVSTIAGANTADFTKRFFGLSANVGKVLDFGNSIFLKPFIGANYYFSYTPDYTESGVLAQHVRSSTNNSLSLEVGAEFRKYFNASSYLFVTPKIEQYVLNNGDDYVARFAGSSSVFSIAGTDKEKTYGQLTIGGNVELSDSWSFNAGIGAKQILAGEVDDKNETYLSGNVGLKYKF